MKSFFYSIILVLLFLLISTALYLSLVGLETSKFNNLIINVVEKNNPRVKIQLDRIKIKLDIKKIQIYLSTYNPIITYQDIKIPLEKVNIYSKIYPLLKSEIEINQIVFLLNAIDTKDFQAIAVRAKPSNFKTYLLNYIKGGKIEKLSADLKFNKNFKIIDYKINGTVQKINFNFLNNNLIRDVNFNFITDKKLSLINSISGKYNGISISNGSINLQNKKNIEIDGKFDTQFNVTEDNLKKLLPKKNFKFLENKKININGNLLHEFNAKFSKNYKLIDYDYKSSGEILKSKIDLKNSFKNNLINKKINQISFDKTKLNINLSKNEKNLISLNGLYSLEESLFKKFKINHDLNKKKNYLIDVDLAENIFVELINFKTNIKNISKVKSNFTIRNNKIIFDYINFTEKKNSIIINNLIINSKNEIEKISKIDVLTFKNKKENNNFNINFKKKIQIEGEVYDSTYLLTQLSGDNKQNFLKNISNDVEIKLKKLITKSQTPLNNFILIGKIEKGKFIKASSKSEFTKNKYLDISLKKDPNNKKILEVYSDLPEVLLSSYKFFSGVREGKLLYRSEIAEKGSVSKLTIEKFKVIEAPTFATLLTLADLGGYADLLSGQGMSFDILEINFSDDVNVTSIEEILALGSSVSLHMDGYIEKKTGLISLRGTLVPAKMLNNLVSKIPVVGKILVGKKVGDGIFGVSFKMKGLPGNIKTTVNPIKTITPRFITRALEKIKKK